MLTRSSIHTCMRVRDRVRESRFISFSHETKKERHQETKKEEEEERKKETKQNKQINKHKKLNNNKAPNKHKQNQEQLRRLPRPKQNKTKNKTKQKTKKKKKKKKKERERERREKEQEQKQRNTAKRRANQPHMQTKSKPATWNNTCLVFFFLFLSFFQLPKDRCFVETSAERSRQCARKNAPDVLFDLN